MIEILTGDCRKVLSSIPDGSINCCVTSPPYFGLRDYGVDDQIGLEETPEEYVAKMVEVFREVRRVLRDDGTLWLNLGDSYAQNGSGTQGKSGQRADRRHTQKVLLPRAPGIKPKDLIGIPWRVAFALQADGWWLRQDIIWHKPNPMPESVKDRCTKAHEYVFLLAKSERYYFDHVAIREPRTSDEDANGFRGGAYVHGETFDNSAGGRRTTSGNVQRKPRPQAPDGHSGGQAGSVPWQDNDGKRNRRSVWKVPSKPFKGAHFATYPVELIEPCILAGCPEGGTVLDPFFGAGTTGWVAREHNRKCIGIELNLEYVSLANKRLFCNYQPRLFY